MITFIAGGILRGAGDARTPMLVTLATLIFSLLLAYPLTFGGLGLPALGLAGAGLANSTDHARRRLRDPDSGLLARPASAVSLAGRGGWRPALGPLRRLASIGFPSMIEALFRSGGMLMFTAIVFQLGTAVVAAQQIAAGLPR